MEIFHEIPPEDRREPPCPYFGTCGGCQLQHMTEARQFVEKQKWIISLLDPVVPSENIRPIQPSPKNWNYRRRIQLHVGPRGEVGFYGPQGQKVVDIKECLIAEEALNRAIPEVRKLAAEALKSRRRPTLLSYELTLNDEGRVEITQNPEERSFLQVNPGANEILIRLLQGTLASLQPKKVLELFAGSGNLTCALANSSPSWTAVEANSRAVLEGEEKCRMLSLPVEWKCGDAGKFLSSYLKNNPELDVVLLDPPREGAKVCMEVLARHPVSRILYVSCDPQSLARDLKILWQRDYAVEWVQPIDFFPQTVNLETLTSCVKTS